VVQKKAKADDVDKGTPFAKIEVRLANCTTKAREAIQNERHE